MIFSDNAASFTHVPPCSMAVRVKLWEGNDSCLASFPSCLVIPVLEGEAARYAIYNF